MEGTEEAGAVGGEAGPDPTAGWRRPARPVVVVAAVVAGVVLVGGVALAARGGDPGPPSAADAESTAPPDRSTSTATEPVDTTPTTLAPTTAAPPVAEAAPTSAPPSSRPAGTAPPATQAATCFAPWPPGSGPLPTVVGGPDKFVAFGPPSTSCVNEADGCMVSVVLRWSDGYTEVGSAVLAEPGSYTVNGDRGTTWTFTVTDDRRCVANGGNYSNVWPPGT